MNMNRFICEEVMGQHSHDDTFKRLECPEHSSICLPSWPDYETTPTDYFALLQFAIRSEWWRSFVWTMHNRCPKEKVHWPDFTAWLLAPENFARLVATYFGWKEEGK